jgi:hypothetical protein
VFVSWGSVFIGLCLFLGALKRISEKDENGGEQRGKDRREAGGGKR